MWLLNAQTKQLEEFVQPVPQYAILSHTWGEDELTFQDVMHGGVEKRGWLKVDLTCRQAVKDGYKHVWIDTCCIDKRSSAELSEAINSMYEWYENSQVCYAYLRDVQEDGTGKSDHSLLNSRWFTRGWTLQELIVPERVEFYGRNWVHLGNKQSLSDTVSEITNIPMPILYGIDSLFSTNLAARMSWASNRHTTRVEDLAYCLLGIFNVNMPLLYGEGRKAFLRLQDEIIKISDDQSIFAWTSTAVGKTTALAEHPRDFAQSANIVPIPRDPSLGAYSMSHTGVMITLPIVETQAYFGEYKICLGLLQCQYAGDYTKQVGIYMYETDAQSFYARCLYRGSYLGSMDVGAAQKIRRQTVHIASPWQTIHTRPKETIIQFHYNEEDGWRRIQIAPAKGVTPTWNEGTKTLRLKRTPYATSHDMDAGFILERPEGECSRCHFLIVAYFPSRSLVTTKVTGIKIYQQPMDWTREDWIKRATQDLSEAHVQEFLSPQDTHEEFDCGATDGSEKHVLIVYSQMTVILRQEVCVFKVGMRRKKPETDSMETKQVESVSSGAQRPYSHFSLTVPSTFSPFNDHSHMKARANSESGR